MQVDHALLAGALVQPIDVLGDQARDPSATLPVCQDAVRRVRPGAHEFRIAELAARPVTLTPLQ